MRTDDFIEWLAREATPVRPLPRPGLRAAAWLLGAVLFTGAIALMLTSSDDVSVNEGVRWFVLSQIAALATSATAAAAAFASVVPGPSPRARLWAAAAALLWLGGLVVTSVQEWGAGGAVALAPQREWLCVAMIGLSGGVLALGMAVMLRRGAPLTPRTTTAMAMLAAASLSNVAACVSHPHTSSVVVLLWHGGTVLALVTLAAWAGRSALTWERLRRAAT